MRSDVAWHFAGCVLSPFYIEAPTIAKERTPKPVLYVHDNTKRLRLFIVPFADARNAAEDHRKIERNAPFVKALRTRTQTKSAFIIYGSVNTTGQMLMRAKIVDDAATGFAVDHVCVEPAGATGLERANPGYRLPAKAVDKSIVLNSKWDIASRFRKHDAAPCAHIQEGNSIE